MICPNASGNGFIAGTLPPYAGFTAFTPTIPKLYWDVYSQEERIKSICRELCKVIAYAQACGAQVNANEAEIEALAQEIAEFKETFADEFQTYYEERIAEWLNAHLEQIITDAVKFVQFGLTMDGYFVAYIPKNWDFLEFDTGANYGQFDYGRLIIRY